MVEELIRKLTTEAEFRLTKQRKYILKELVDHQKEHLIAEDIYESLKEKGSKVGLATIYRTLDLLEKEDIIIKRKFTEKSAHYEVKLETKQDHYHLICKSCGKVIEGTNLLEEDLVEQLKCEEGFVVEDFCLQMHGLCSECRKKNIK